MRIQQSILMAAAAALFSATTLLAQQPAKVNSSGGTSPHETTSTVIGGRNGNRVTLVYGRPYSKDPKDPATIRPIWGALVPWDKVWRLGSDEATMLIIQQPIVLGGTTLPAGAYTLYMLPEETGTSKLIINKQLGQWGIPYPADLQKQELARVDLKKDTLDKSVDQFTMAVVGGGGGSGLPAGTGQIKITWEKTQFTVDFTPAPKP